MTTEEWGRRKWVIQNHHYFVGVTLLLFPFILSAVLKNAFDAFDQEKKGCIDATMVGTILSMLGHQLDDKMLAEIIAEVDDDGSGEIEFAEFCTLAARFLVEEDAEAMQQELKEAFRLYDKEGMIGGLRGFPLGN